MMYMSDITTVIQQWKQRLRDSTNDSSYKVALSECIHDLEDTINSTVGQQINDNYYS